MKIHSRSFIPPVYGGSFQLAPQGACLLLVVIPPAPGLCTAARGRASAARRTAASARPPAQRRRCRHRVSTGRLRRAFILDLTRSRIIAHAALAGFLAGLLFRGGARLGPVHHVRGLVRPLAAFALVPVLVRVMLPRAGKAVLMRIAGGVRAECRRAGGGRRRRTGRGRRAGEGLSYFTLSEAALVSLLPPEPEKVQYILLPSSAEGDIVNDYLPHGLGIGQPRIGRGELLHSIALPAGVHKRP